MSLSELIDNLYNFSKKALITTLISTQLCCGTAYANENNRNFIVSDRNQTHFTINRELPSRTRTIQQSPRETIQISPNFNPCSERNYSLEIKTKKSLIPKKINDAWIAIGIQKGEIGTPKFAYQSSKNASYRDINKKLQGNSITNFLEEIIMETIYSIPYVGKVINASVQLQEKELSQTKNKIIQTLINYDIFKDYNIWICQLPPIISGYESIKMDLPIQRDSKDRHILISIYTKNQHNDSKTKEDHLFLLYEDGKFLEKDLLELQSLYNLPNYYNTEFYDKYPRSKLSDLPNNNITIYE